MKQWNWRKPLLLSTVAAGVAMLILDSAALAIQFTTTYTFDSSAASNQSSEPVDANPTGAVFSDITRGPGVISVPTTNSINSSSWTQSGSVDLDDYYQFSIEVQPNYELDLTELVFSERRSATGIRNIDIRFSSDSFATATSIAAISVPDDSATRRQAIPLTSVTQLQNLVC